MSILWRVTWRNLKANRMRTTVTVIGILLSAAMICAVTSFAASIRNYMVQTTVYTNGDWHGSALDEDVDTLIQLQQEDAVESLVYARQLGYAVAEGSQNQFKPYLFLLAADDSFFNTMPVHLTRGRYPRNGQEILLPDHLAENGGVVCDLGTELVLDVGHRDLEGFSLGQNDPSYIYDGGKEVPNGERLLTETTQRYRVVGFYERPEFEPYTAPGYTCITYWDGAVVEGSYDVYFKLWDMEQIYGFISQRQLSGSVNSDLLSYHGVSGYRGFYTVLYSLATVVILLILFGAVSLIYNAFSISVTERTRQFGLLSSVGATKKQLRRMVLCEALTVSGIGIPLGVLSGIGGIGVTLQLIGHRFTVLGSYPIPLRLHVSWPSVAVALVVALLTVLISAWIPSRRATRVAAVSAIRQQEDIRQCRRREGTPRLTLWLFGISGVLAKKHFARSARRYRATVLSLFMSIVLFVSASSFSDTMRSAAGVGLYTENYDLSVSVTMTELGHLTPQSLLEQITVAEGVTDAAYTRVASFQGSLPRELLTTEAIKYEKALQIEEAPLRQGYAEVRCVVYFADEASFLELLESNGLPVAEYTDPEAPKAVVLDNVTFFDYEQEAYHTARLLRQGEFAVSAAEEKQIDGYYCAGTVLNDQGVPVVRYHLHADPSQTLELPLEEGYVYRDLQVGAVVTEKPLFSRRFSGLSFVYPVSAVSKVLRGSLYGEEAVRFSVASSDHEKSEGALKRILAGEGLQQASIYNYAAEVENERNMLLMVNVFTYGFIALISLVAAANVFHTISTNLMLRRREFGVLTSVGMSRKGFRRMLNYECLLYGLRALLWGLPASLWASLLIQYSVYSGFSRAITVPWRAMGIASVSVFAVVFVSMLYTMHKLRKDNPIDSLRNENL